MGVRVPGGALGLAVLLLAVSAAHAIAQPVRVSRAQRPLPPRSRPYPGVAPGQGRAPPIGPAPRDRATAVTWPGFQLRDEGGSRFFLQTNGNVALRTTVQPDRVVVILERVRIAGRNNRRPLITRFFDTPVTQAHLERRGKHAAFVLELRRPVQPVVSQQRTPSGYCYVLVELPAAAPAEPATEPAEPAAPTRKEPDAPRENAAPRGPAVRGKAEGRVETGASPGRVKGKAKGGIEGTLRVP